MKKISTSFKFFCLSGFIAAILLTGFSTITRGQSFTLSTNDTMIVNINANETKDAEFDFTNNLAGSLSLTWHTLVDTVPTCWTAQVCDYGTCYTVLPHAHVMDSVPHGAFGFLKLTVTLHEYGGAGKIQFFVEETDNPGVGDTVTFIINGPTTTNCSMVVVPAISKESKARVYPNPVLNDLFFDNGDMGAFRSYEVYNVIGTKIQGGTINPAQRSIAFSTLAPGVYIIRLTSVKGEQFTGRFVKKVSE